MTKYELMHKDQVCGWLVIDEVTGRLADYKDNGSGLSPYMGNSDLKKMVRWWEMRAVPASRTGISELLKAAGCYTPGLFLAKNLALSMTDAYWIRPEGMYLKYEDIKFSNLYVGHDGKVPYHNATSYDPNASLGGQMEKYWDLSRAVPTLVKESYKHFGQQAINEVLATRIHERQDTDVPFTRYSATLTEDRGVICECEAFTSDKVEFISAYEVLESRKTANDRSLYDNYIDICSRNGIDRAVMQDFMDYQTVTDFIISNTDEHLANFGVLRDADTMRLIGPAPIFDSGNSMFYDDTRSVPYSRADLLARKVTGFYKTEEGIMKQVKNRGLVRLDLLPSGSEIKNLYVNAGIPEKKADFISRNYETKVSMASEFQRGATLSYYIEKQKEKEEQRSSPGREGQQMPEGSFIMLCGIPGSGKSDKAAEICRSLQKAGMEMADAASLYPAIDAARDSNFLIDKRGKGTAIEPGRPYQGKVMLISVNEIRGELDSLSLHYRDALVFHIAETRTRIALMGGATVIYDAPNLHAKDREAFLRIADEAGVANRQVLVMRTGPEYADSDIPDGKLKVLAQQLANEYPSVSEGWTEIVEETARTDEREQPGVQRKEEDPDWVDDR